ncbi:alpha/beta fold hydrolase [Halomonas heilongjiangensis]|nr:alpha/beta hydrolase [Halomonas heilongjiangensis]
MPCDIRHLLNVTEHGRGSTPLVMVHGFGCDQTVWSRIVPVFEADYRIILLDLAGFGASDRSAFDPGRHARPEGHAEDLVALCDALGLEDAVLLGHSIGGTIGLMAAIERPRTFRRLLLVCSSARYLDDPPAYCGGYGPEQLDALLALMEQNYLDWASSLSTVALGTAATPGWHHDLQQRLLAVRPEVLRPLARAVFLGDIRHLLPRVPVPSVVVQTTHDAIVPLSAADYLQRHLPDSELELLDCAGHYPQLTAPERLTRALKAHLPSPTAR